VNVEFRVARRRRSIAKLAPGESHDIVEHIEHFKTMEFDVPESELERLRFEVRCDARQSRSRISPAELQPTNALLDSLLDSALSKLGIRGIEPAPGLNSFKKRGRRVKTATARCAYCGSSSSILISLEEVQLSRYYFKFYRARL